MRRLGLIILFSVLVGFVQARTYVVCAGISDYPGTGNDLRVSAYDAQTIDNIFQKNKYSESLCYMDANATTNNIIEAMNTMFGKADKDDVIMLYFSGHGIHGGLVCYDGYLYYSTIYQVMRKFDVHNKVIFADACFSGKMRYSNQRNDSRSKENVMLFLSSRSTELSMEMPIQTGFHNSLFTVFLERGLRGGADTDRNRILTANELYTYVHEGVVKASGNHQHPVMWGKFDGFMPVIKW